MVLFAMLIRTGIFAEGHFLGKIVDEWGNDSEEFVHIKLPHIVVIVMLAFILSRLIAALTNRMVRVGEKRDASSSRHSQLKTFAGVLKTTLNAILWTLTVLQLLESLGFNLGPLLASAGVAGIAIGLAAQTIVKDILNGMLVVVEDQFNLGDVVKLVGMTGTVESMSLRRTELRDGDGTLYVIPNSQITTVANLSRDFSVATVNVSVDFSASPDKVVALLTKVAMEIRNDKAFAPVFLKDPEILGVDSIVGSQVVYPVVFKTLATKQYGPIREFRRRIRIALEENSMLPGDPNRVFRNFEGAPGSLNALPADTEQAAKAGHAAEKAVPDPTAIAPDTHNPFIATS
jgi:small conductance mechanosensitive channel